MDLKEKLPDSYSHIDETLDSAKLILSEAVSNTQTLFHTPVVSTTVSYTHLTLPTKRIV